MFYGGGRAGEDLASLFRQFVNQQAEMQRMQAEARSNGSGNGSSVRAVRQRQHEESFGNIKEATWSLIPHSTES